MAKPRKHKGETIFNYIPDYLPSSNVDSPMYVKLPPGTKDSRLKDVERELIEYWDLLHPLVKEYMMMVVKYVNKFGEGSDDLEHLRRSLDIELSNSSELSDENRKLKAQVADLLIEKKALNEKISDMNENRPIVSAEELVLLPLVLPPLPPLSFFAHQLSLELLSRPEMLLQCPTLLSGFSLSM